MLGVIFCVCMCACVAFEKCIGFFPANFYREKTQGLTVYRSLFLLGDRDGFRDAKDTELKKCRDGFRDS